MITIQITREQLADATVDFLKDFRRDLILDAQPDDGDLIKALEIVINSMVYPAIDFQTTDSQWSGRQHPTMRIKV